MKNSDKIEQSSSKESKDEINLSQALLAPLNAIIEAQVHSARAFLNFILQMGFRHKYTDEEKKELENSKTDVKALKIINEENKAKERIGELESKMQSTQLSTDEMNELRSLRLQWNDLYLQRFDYFDDKGNVTNIYVPNLALLPVRPLAINNANFKFEIFVKNSNETFDQMGSVDGTSGPRPWFLIKPRRINGEFSKGDSTEKNIKVEVNVSSTDIPYGLDKLLASLTNSISIVNKIDTSKNE